MKRTYKLFLLSAFLLLLITSGCKKEENPVDGGGGGNNTTSTYPTPTNFNGASPKNVLAVVRTSISQMGFTFSMGIGVANLDNQDKGTVTATVDGDDYEFTKQSANGVVSYTYVPSATNPTGGMSLGSGAENVTFSVSNYALAAATVTVPGEITITAPAANASVPRSSDLNVTWTSSSSGTNKAIFIVDQSGKSIFKEVSGNTGTFTSAELGGLSAGNGIVYAMTYNYVLTNNNEAVLIGEALATNSITLQ